MLEASIKYSIMHQQRKVELEHELCGLPQKYSVYWLQLSAVYLYFYFTVKIEVTILTVVSTYKHI